MSSKSLLELQSNKAQLEVGLIYLKRKYAELQKQLSRQQRLHNPRALLSETQEQAAAIGAEIEKRRLAIDYLDARIREAHRLSSEDGIERLRLSNERLSREISVVRTEVLESLRALAEPLRRYQGLVDRKTAVTKQISAKTGKDQAYSNYIECALLRQSDYDDDLQLVVELINRLRVVS